MNKNFNLLGGALLGAVALLGTAALPASAATTFSVEGGALSITVAATADLDGAGFAAQSGGEDAVGSLGAVSVDDARGVNTGWRVEASSTAFTSGVGGTTSTDVLYATGTVTGSQVNATGSTGSIATVRDVVTTADATSNNTASWSPTITVALPSTALAGNYSGTVTTSVI